MSSALPTVVVSGYASVDYAMRLGSFQGSNATTVVRSRAEEWPRYGGIAHVTREVVRASGGGARVVTLSWVGPDADGTAWARSVSEGGALTDGVSVLGSRSPSSHLLYPEGSGTICLFDQADCHPDTLTEGQRRVLEGADVAVVTVGPPALTRELVDALPQRCSLVWIVKHDPSSLPEDLAVRLAGRSQLITLSDEESGYLGTISRTAQPGTFVARTNGAEGAELLRIGEQEEIEMIGTVPTARIEGIDTTGAGDTFSGALAARLASTPKPTPEQMLGFVAVSVEAATNMLAARAGAVRDGLSNQHQEEE